MNARKTVFASTLMFAMSPVMAQTGTHSNPTNPSSMVEMYAADYKVSLTEAARRMQKTDEVSRIQSRARERFPSTFSDLVIENTPRYRIVVRFTRDAVQSLATLTSDPEYVAATALYTERERDATQAALSEQLDASGIDFFSLSNPGGNSIKVYTREPEKLAAVLATNKGLKVPIDVQKIPATQATP